MSLKNATRGAVTAGAAAAALLVATGVGYAYWTAGGTGTGSAAAGTSSPMTTLTVDASTSSLLFPGGTADVLLRINNPNSFPIKVTQIAAAGSVTVAKAGIGTCTTTGVSMTTQTSTTGWIVPARSNEDVRLTGAATMDNTSDSGCQGASFTVPVSFSGTSQ